MGMLTDYNGSTVSVVTGVTIGEPCSEAFQTGPGCRAHCLPIADPPPSSLSDCVPHPPVQPQLTNPGYSVKHLMVETKVNFAENSPALLKAYVDSGEGADK